MVVKRLIGFLERKISLSKLNKITLISALLEATYFELCCKTEIGCFTDYCHIRKLKVIR